MLEIIPTANDQNHDVKTNEKSQTISSAKKLQTLAWGRSSVPSPIGSAIILIAPPLFVFFFFTSCSQYQCRPERMIEATWQAILDENLNSLLESWKPSITWKDAAIWSTWFVFQAFLYSYVPPSVIAKGQVTPAGQILSYNINGLRSFIISFITFLIGAQFGFWKLSIIADHWSGLVVMANIAGYLTTFFCFLKAYTFPTHPQDRKFSGNFLYDLYMGIEFNPRIGKMFDFKLFFNGRPGIIAWPLISLSFGAAQWQRDGYLSNGFIGVFALHLLYVVDFFYNEDWYLRTIDIAHDHMGFILAWGDLVWLPTMYTLQGQYLFQQPVTLSKTYLATVALLGLSGYYIFRATNYQKDLVRRHDGKVQIWGKEAKVIRASFTTIDGQEHQSILLCSGWWGLARQINYLGDIAIALASCLCCGVSGNPIIGYFYFFWMVGLLTHRVYRSDQRCRAKYGKYWEQYCQQVPYKIIPGIF